MTIKKFRMLSLLVPNGNVSGAPLKQGAYIVPTHLAPPPT